jgi:nucleotide-binding universal stress UspA family protein
MKTLKTVVVPLDGSALAGAAIPYAVAMAKAFCAELALLGVVEQDPAVVFEWDAEIQAYLERAREASLLTHLKVTAGTVRDRGIAATEMVRSGDPSEEILAYAEQTDAVAVVMATHGRSGLDRWFIGSVADKVMRSSPRPLLLVRPDEAGAHPSEVTLHRLMVPLDGSSAAEAAVPLAAQIARATGASITLVRVEPFLEARVAPFAFPYDVSRLDEEINAVTQAYLIDVHERLLPDIAATSTVLRGAATTALQAFVARDRPDLTVMTTHGRGGLRRLIIGSTADRLVRAGIPILLTRGTAAPGSGSDHSGARFKAPAVPAAGVLHDAGEDFGR